MSDSSDPPLTPVEVVPASAGEEPGPPRSSESILFRCPSCSSLLKSPRSRIGAEGPCPNCGHTVRVVSHSSARHSPSRSAADKDGPGVLSYFFVGLAAFAVGAVATAAALIYRDAGELRWPLRNVAEDQEPPAPESPRPQPPAEADRAGRPPLAVEYDDNGEPLTE